MLVLVQNYFVPKLVLKFWFCKILKKLTDVGGGRGVGASAEGVNGDSYPAMPSAMHHMWK